MKYGYNIGLGASKEKPNENIDAKKTDPACLISSSGAFVSWKLIKIKNHLPTVKLYKTACVEVKREREKARLSN